MTTPISDRARKARWVPANYSPDEVAAARAVLAHWNTCFAGVVGASRAQVNRADNLRAVVRELRSARREADAGGTDEFARLTAATIRDAITAYAADDGCRKLGRWKSFRDWLDAETVLKYASVAQARGLAAPREMSARERAKRIIGHKNLENIAAEAMVCGQRLSKYITESLRLAERRYDATMQQLDSEPDPRKKREHARGVAAARAVVDHWTEINSLAARREAVAQRWPRERWHAICDRARQVFGDAYGRRPDGMAGVDADDVIRLNAIILALLDLEHHGHTSDHHGRAGPDRRARHE